MYSNICSDTAFLNLHESRQRHTPTTGHLPLHTSCTRTTAVGLVHLHQRHWTSATATLSHDTSLQLIPSPTLQQLALSYITFTYHKALLCYPSQSQSPHHENNQLNLISLRCYTGVPLEWLRYVVMLGTYELIVNLPRSGYTRPCLHYLAPPPPSCLSIS